MLTKIQSTVDFLKERMTLHPETAIILGSGLGQLTEEIDIVQEFAYADIPHFPLSTVEGHSGRLIIGQLGGKPVLAMQGRFHYYEGYSMQEVTFPIRVMHLLGIKNLFVSNAAGGMSPTFSIGSLMIITDHINALPENPLRGRNLPFGPRFPSMHRAYDPEFIAIVKEVAAQNGIDVKEGVYIATQGPTYETPAEYRMFRSWGADAVGMSTVPEVIVAVHQGMRVFGMSVITDLGGFDVPQAVSHEEVTAAANAAQPRMTLLMRQLLQRV